MRSRKTRLQKSLSDAERAFLLANIARHISLTAEEALRFLSVMERIEAGNKDLLLAAGEINRYLNFVLKGCLRSFSTDEQGREHNVLFSPEDWWCGDLFSFHTGNASGLSIQAIEASVIVRISKADLENLYPEVPKFERFFRILFQNGFVMYQNRVESNLSGNAQERYRQFEKVYPGLASRIAARHIASYIGVTPEFFSNMKRN